MSGMITFFYDAILKYMVEVEGDPVRKAAVKAKAGLWFGDMNAGLIDKYLAAKATHEPQIPQHSGQSESSMSKPAARKLW